MPPAEPLRVCYFNRSYWPDTGATGQLLTELAEDLVRVHGMDVTVVAGFPLTGAPAASHETRNGVRIIRARGTTFAPGVFYGRAANYVTYFLSALWAAWRLPRQDVTVALTDPPIIGIAALAAGPKRGMVFLCQDIFPEVTTVVQDFQSTAVYRLLDRISRMLVARATRVIAVGETMAQRLIDGKGADASRLTVIHNWADTTAIVPSDKSNAFSRAHGLDRKFVVLHAGNMGLSQNLEVVVEAAARLRDRDDIVFLFIGDGSRRKALEQDVRDRELGNVKFLPYQPREDLRWTYASSDVCLVSLKPELAGYIVPSKLYPILAAGRPYIAAVDSTSEVAALTTLYGCGVLVEPGDAGALAEQVRLLAEDAQQRADCGARARHAAARFGRDRRIADHARVLADVAGR